MALQWLGMQEKERCALKEKQSDCHINDKEAILACDERRRRATTKHDPRMLVPVLNTNSGIKNFECFNATFGNMIQNEALLSDGMLDIKKYPNTL